MITQRTLMIAGGTALWLSLFVSFLAGLSLRHLPGVATSQLLMVLFLVLATLLLGVLIGKTARPAQPETLRACSATSNRTAC